MKLPRPVYISLTAFILMLIIMTGCLFRQNFIYRSINRQLLLQNDSLKGVTIELNRKIERSQTDSLLSKASKN